MVRSACGRPVPCSIVEGMLRRFWMVLASVVALTSILTMSRVARAEATPVAVLPIDSEDAEDQAEALTTALRSRVKDSPALRLSETSQSLGVLTTALKCSRVPDTTCQTKIADQLKLERYVWGTMQKSPGSQVTVELHLFQRGKATPPIRETYSDNLRDQNDETLRKVAQRLLDRLLGRTSGTVVVRVSPAVAGEVVVDGGRRVPLSGGSARVEVGYGAHAVEVVAKGYGAQKREVAVPPGGDVSVDVTLTPTPAEGPKVNVDAKSFPVRTVAGFGAIGVGVAAGVVSGVFTAQWLDLRSQQAEHIALAPKGLDVCSNEARSQTQNGGGAADSACKNSEDAKKKSIVAWTAGGIAAGAIGIGVFLVLTDKGDSSEKPPSKASRVRAIPDVGPQGGSLTVVGTF